MQSHEYKSLMIRMNFFSLYFRHPLNVHFKTYCKSPTNRFPLALIVESNRLIIEYFPNTNLKDFGRLRN